MCVSCPVVYVAGRGGEREGVEEVRQKIETAAFPSTKKTVKDYVVSVSES